MQELGYHKHFDPAYIEERMRHAKGSSTYRRRISPRRSSLESVDMISHTEKPIASKKPFSYAATEHSDGGNEIDESGATENGAVSDDWYHPSDDIPTGEVFAMCNQSCQVKSSHELSLSIVFDMFCLLQSSQCFPRPIIVTAMPTKQLF